ncbi:MAG TPA: hypothetical protein VEU31_03055 [Candidatus Acidoferrales bacterium]|nr:hypothetical protein [Candidatus Acidoferrales bacterium]
MRPCVFSFALMALCIWDISVGNALGQSSSSSQPSSGSAPSSKQENSSQTPSSGKPSKPRKIWTEDDLNTLKANVSIVGNPSGARGTLQKKPQAGKPQDLLPPEKDPAWYQRQLSPLRAQIERIDAEIRKMKGVQDGKETSDAGRQYNGADLPLNSQDRIEFLGKKKREFQDRVEALEDQARRNGINPGDLR